MEERDKQPETGKEHVQLFNNLGEHIYENITEVRRNEANANIPHLRNRDAMTTDFPDFCRNEANSNRPHLRNRDALATDFPDLFVTLPSSRHSDLIDFDTPFVESLYTNCPEDEDLSTILLKIEVSNIVDELLTSEKLYVAKMNFVYHNYMQPAIQMGEQMKVIFGNIDEIKNFHEIIFYPELIRCNGDLIPILECISKHVIAGHFYIYNIYVLNQNKSGEEKNKETSKHYLEKCRNEMGDKLGVNSYLMEPYQRLFKYKNLINSIKDKLSIDTPNFPEIEIAATKALHVLTELLDTINESVAINDIIDSKINFMNQGNFIAQKEFEIFDYNQNRRYQGKLFLFQKCVVCTEYTSSGTLQFKSYFPHHIGRMECINKKTFELYDGSYYKIEVTCTSAEVIQRIMEQIRSFKIHAPGKFNIRNYDSQKSNSDSYSDYGSCTDSGEYVLTPSIDDFANIEKQQFKNNAPQTAPKPAPRPSLLPSTKVIEEMLLNENDYVRQLTIGIQTYMELFENYRTILEIRDYHENSLYPFLKNCNNDVIKIANVFLKVTKEGQFNSYKIFAMNHEEIESISKKYKHWVEDLQHKDQNNQQLEYYLQLLSHRLRVYKDYLDSIINSLNIGTQSKQIAECSKAINAMENLIEDVDSYRMPKKKTNVLRSIRRKTNF